MTGGADANERDESDNPQVAINMASEETAQPTETTTVGSNPADPYGNVLRVWWNREQTVCVFCFKWVSDERKSSLRLYRRWCSADSDKLELIGDVPYIREDDPCRIRIDCSDNLRNIVVVAVWEQRPNELSKWSRIRGPDSVEELYTGYVFRSTDFIHYTMSKLDIQGRYSRIYVTDVAILGGQILFSAVGQSFSLRLMVIPYDLSSRRDGGAVGFLKPRILHTPETTLYDKLVSGDGWDTHFLRSTDLFIVCRRQPLVGASPILKMYRVLDGDLVFSFTGAKGCIVAPEIVWSNDMFVLILERFNLLESECSGYLNFCSLQTGCVIYRHEFRFDQFLAEDYQKMHIVTDVKSLYFGMAVVLYDGAKPKATSVKLYDIASARYVGPGVRLANCDHRFVRCTKDYQFGSLQLAGKLNVTTNPPIELRHIDAEDYGVLNVEYNQDFDTPEKYLDEIMVDLDKEDSYSGGIVRCTLFTGQYTSGGRRKTFSILPRVVVRHNGCIFVVYHKSVTLFCHKAFLGSELKGREHLSWRYDADAEIEGFTFRFLSDRRLFAAEILAGRNTTKIPYGYYLSYESVSTSEASSGKIIRYEEPTLFRQALRLSQDAEGIEQMLFQSIEEGITQGNMNDRHFTLSAELGLLNLRRDPDILAGYIKQASKEFQVENLSALVPHIPYIIPMYPAIMRQLLSLTSQVALKGSYPYLLARRITALSSHASLESVANSRPGLIGPHQNLRKHSGEILYFPFRGISRYYPKSESIQSTSSAKAKKRSVFERLFISIRDHCVLPLERRSIYQQILELDDATLLRCGIFRNMHFEALNLYKWRAFAQWRFMMISAFRIMLYVSIWCISSSQVTSEPIAVRALLSLALVISLVFIAQEFRQLLNDRLVGYWSLYNVLDMATYIMAIALCMQWMVTNNINSSLYATTVLFVWVHLILQLRALHFGRLSMIFDSVTRIVTSLIGFWIALVILTFGFAHAFWSQSLNNNQALSNYDPEAASNPSNATNTVQLVQTWESVWFFVTGNYNNYV
ncbi:hypothetical protein BZG36_05560, partial [Bifiguratus adelaidae]